MKPIVLDQRKESTMQKVRVYAKTYANKWFKHFKPEDEKGIGEYKLKEDAALKKLKELYWECDSIFNGEGNGGLVKKQDMYEIAMKTIWKRVRKYSSEDVTNFSLALGSMRISPIGDGLGMFISALINRCEDSDFTIVTAHTDWHITSLGYNNTKRIAIKGNAGSCLGEKNQGDITVEGDTWTDSGFLMAKGGILTIKGNAGGKAGYNCAGTIYLEGDYKSIGPYLDGSIYHKGKLIAQFDHEAAEKYSKDLREGRNPPDSDRPKVKIFGNDVRYCGIVANGVVINDGIDRY